MLILVMGLPGTGKTTFARTLAERINAIHLNSDRVRTSMGKRGAYSAADKQVVYAEMFRRAEKQLQLGHDVIVDSTFYKESIRIPYFELAKKLGVSLKLIVIRATEPTLEKRLAKPRPDSEADFQVYLKIKEAYEPPKGPILELWSDQLSVGSMVKQVIQEGEISCH